MQIGTICMKFQNPFYRKIKCLLKFVPMSMLCIYEFFNCSYLAFSKSELCPKCFGHQNTWVNVINVLTHIPYVFLFAIDSGFAKKKLITKTCLFNFDSLEPRFYIVKLGFTGVYIIFLISAQKHRLWALVRTASPRRF